MATRIPLPGNMIDSLLNGFKVGSDIYSTVQQPRLAREKMKQLEEHFQEELKLKKAAAGRAGANSDLQRQLLLQKLDPMHEINQYKALENWIKGQSANQQNNVSASMPTEELGEGMGVFSPEGLQEAQQQPQVNNPGGSGNQGGVDLELLKQNPLLRGFFKKHIGYDPLAAIPQTLQEKQDAALDLFKQKEALKMQNKGGDTPTNTVLTQNQQAIQGIDTVIPMLDELLASKDIPGILDFSPGKKAAYNAKTSSMIDTLIAAQTLPKVQASIDLVEEQIRRNTGETVTDYKKRLRSLRDDLVKRRGRSQAVVKTRKVNTAPLEDFSHLSDDELRKIAGGG